MLKRKNLIFQLLLLVVTAFSGMVDSDDLFGMRLTTESLKTRENMQYRFHYFVKDDLTGDYKIQEETKEGDSVHGSYTLAEPNGDLRTVTYKAGPGKGFEAKINVHPSGSPMKQFTQDPPVSEAAVTSDTKSNSLSKAEKQTKSNVKLFPGGFIMDVLSKPQSESSTKTEMGMKFSVKANPATVPVTNLSSAVTVAEFKATEKPEISQEITRSITNYGRITTDHLASSTVENFTFPAEDRETSEDPIEKEIDEAINSMPKLPELVLSDNKTHLKFHKDPEEALLDERITQIARQLAETSLRREYEERKLGHFIPISVSSVEPSTLSYLSKSFKFNKNELRNFAPSEPSSLHVLTQLRVVPQYIYEQTLIPRISPLNNRLPVASLPKTQQWNQKTHELMTNPHDVLKVNKLENTGKGINKIFKEKRKYSTNYETANTQPTSVMPAYVPTFLQFFSPYVMQTTGSYVTPEPQFHSSTAKRDLMTGDVPLKDDRILFPRVTTVKDKPT